MIKENNLLIGITKDGFPILFSTENKDINKDKIFQSYQNNLDDISFLNNVKEIKRVKNNGYTTLEQMIEYLKIFGKEYDEDFMQQAFIINNNIAIIQNDFLRYKDLHEQALDKITNILLGLMFKDANKIILESENVPIIGIDVKSSRNVPNSLQRIIHLKNNNDIILTNIIQINYIDNNIRKNIKTDVENISNKIINFIKDNMCEILINNGKEYSSFIGKDKISIKSKVDLDKNTINFISIKFNDNILNDKEIVIDFKFNGEYVVKVITEHYKTNSMNGRDLSSEAKDILSKMLDFIYE